MSCRQGGYRRLNYRLAAAAIAVSTALAAVSARSADFTWTGNAGTSWNNAANWSNSAVPNSSTANAIIDSSASSPGVDLDIDAVVRTLRIDSGKTLNIPGNRHLDVNGNATLGGTLQLLAAPAGTPYVLFAGGDRLLDGTGTLRMAGAASRIFVTNNTNNRLTFAAGLTVEGNGDLGAGITRFTNLGTVRANLDSPLKVNPSNIANAFINQGTLEATGTSTLQLAGVTYTNTGGLIRASGGFVDIDSGATIVGGTLGTTGNGQIRTTGGAGLVTLDGITLNGVFDLRNGYRLDLKSSLANNGVLQLNSTGTLTDVQLRGDVTVSGSGSIVLTNAANSRIYGDTGSGPRRFTIGAGQTVKGTGKIGASQTKITNEGTLLADQPSALTIEPVGAADGFLNRGTIEVRNGSTLTVGSGTSLVQDGTTALTNVLGTLTVADLKLQAGTLAGTGSVAGSVSNSGGTVAPGASPGKLSISGNYTQQAGGTLVFEIDGNVQGVSYDWLNVTGTASLAGTAVLDFGFTPQVGATFVVLTASSVTGRFDAIVAPAGWLIQDAYGPGNVTLTVAAVPEPKTYALMFAGLGLVSWAAWRRAQRKVPRPAST